MRDDIEASSTPGDSRPNRRNLIKAASWTAPVVAVSVAAPAIAASETPNYGFQSAFGIGWYPNFAGQTNAGFLQYDGITSQNQYLRVTETSPGDVVTNVYFELYLQTGWPLVTFTAQPNSNPNWSTLASIGSTRVIDGINYRVYRSSYTGSITASGSTTEIPVNFSFRASSPYYASQGARTARFATVKNTPVELLRARAVVNNTNVPSSQSPKP